MIIFTVFCGPFITGEAALISVDFSLVWAIGIFFAVIVALNYLLFKPLLAVQEERASKTSGVIAKAQKDTDHHLDLFHRFQATIKQARLEGYQHQESVRSQALKDRVERLEQARAEAEQLLMESRTSIQSQVAVAKERLDQEAKEIGRRIAAAILQRSA